VSCAKTAEPIDLLFAL